MIMRHLLLVLALASGSAVSHADHSGRPVMIGAEADLDACTSVGVVAGLDPHGDGFLAVRSGPGSNYPLLEKIYEGQSVFICDTAAGDKWYGIVYSRRNDADCGVASPVAHPQPYRGRCKSGWVSAHWIRMTAG
jgi:hypothetical protein